MGIRFIKEKNQFILSTKNTAYAFEIIKNKYLYHLYYGKKNSKIDSAVLKEYAFSPYLPDGDALYAPNSMPTELSFFGSGDFRSSFLRVLGADGTGVTDFSYKSYRIFKGRKEINRLPFARADENSQTLEITMYDDVTNCTLKLYYTVFPNSDVISRYMTLVNNGEDSVKIEKCMSLQLDISNADMDMISVYGKVYNECKYQRVPLHYGTQMITSRRGASSHEYNPFMALCTHNATEERGDVYGFNFVYSGSFLNEVELDDKNIARVLMGLGSECFNYTLKKGEAFDSPEAIMTYSANGIGRMTRNFHDFTRNNIMPQKAFEPHPVVLNTWEGSGMNIDENMLIAFAKEAKKIGFDMLVMDDGWFGARNTDLAGLGDWFENKNKFPNGLADFAKRIKKEGVQFGIWIEPEMVNPDSDLYRLHPEWCLHVPSRARMISRWQLVLDMSNEEVLKFLMNSFEKTFEGVPIDYFKWDMNRYMNQVGSSALSPEYQGEVWFRYMKGVYKLLSWFEEKYPNAVIETCSGGGGRYDLGMMRYGIQIWTSDNTNPYDRTYIQSTALKAYPASTMSCHVSNPKGNLKSLDYRYKVAVGGMLGYEFDILEMSEEIKRDIARQIKEYKEFEHIMRLGDYYELASPTKYPYSAYYYASKDNSEFVMTVIETSQCKEKGSTKLLKIKNAIADAKYTEIYSKKQYSGDELRRGLKIELTAEEDTAHLLYFKKIN